MAPPPLFWRTPLQYLRYQSHQQPAIFYSIVLGMTSPVILLGVPPLRKRLGYENHNPVPQTYPIPNRAREPVPAGFEDDE